METETYGIRRLDTEQWYAGTMDYEHRWAGLARAAAFRGVKGYGEAVILQHGMLRGGGKKRAAPLLVSVERI